MNGAPLPTLYPPLFLHPLSNNIGSHLKSCHPILMNPSLTFSLSAQFLVFSVRQLVAAEQVETVSLNELPAAAGNKVDERWFITVSNLFCILPSFDRTDPEREGESEEGRHAAKGWNWTKPSYTGCLLY